MPDSLSLLLSGVLAWLAGSIPCSLLVALWGGGVDLRKHGSGNVGATNVARTVGAKWGALALLLDALKGALPVLLLPMLLPTSDALTVHQRVLSAVAAILGHMFSPFLGFKGGKGMATGLGVATVLAPLATLFAFLAFVIAFAATRIVSISSMIAAASFAGFQLIVGGAALWSASNWSLAAFSVAVPLLIIVKHRANIGRLLRGEEAPLQFGKR